MGMVEHLMRTVTIGVDYLLCMGESMVGVGMVVVVVIVC